MPAATALSGLQEALVLTSPMSCPMPALFLTTSLLSLTTVDDSPLPRSLSSHRELGKTSPTLLASPPDSPPCTCTIAIVGITLPIYLVPPFTPEVFFTLLYLANPTHPSRPREQLSCFLSLFSPLLSPPPPSSPYGSSLPLQTCSSSLYVVTNSLCPRMPVSSPHST